MQIVGQTWFNLMTCTCGIWSEGQHDLYFTVHWFCLISWRLFDVCMYIILWEYEPVWPDVWPKTKCKSLWPIFHGPVILSYILKTILCMNILFWDYESLWPGIWPQNKCRSLWPTFHGPVILLYILNTIWCMNIIHVLSDYRSVWPDVWPQNKCRSMWPVFHGPMVVLYLQDYLMHECHIFRYRIMGYFCVAKFSQFCLKNMVIIFRGF